jgi:predicted metal-dependent hydrolase
MGRADSARQTPVHCIRLAGRRIQYRLVHSNRARKLRIRVGPDGVEVVQPAARDPGEVAAFLAANCDWILEQLVRAERLRRVRRPARHFR